MNIRERLDTAVASGIGVSLSWKEAKEVEAHQTENKRLREALEETHEESGKVDIANWPAQQQICQSIAGVALKGTEIKEAVPA